MRPERSIAEAVSETWFSHHQPGGIAIPVGVVASVLVTDPQALMKLPTMSTEEFTDLLRKVWASWWLEHPHLATMARPITSWLDDPNDRTAAAAKAVAETAMRKRVKSYQGLETDILSYVVTELRSHGARKGLGEHHTPPDVCDAMAAMLMTELPEKGMTFDEPTAGSGGMVRAFAQQIKRLGGDPANYVWSMTDIDDIAAACSAVNALVWNLGSHVYVWCGDTIKHGDGFERAAKHKAEAVSNWAEAVKTGREVTRLLRAAHDVEALLTFPGKAERGA
ncbi:hypothetical protein GCM10022252_19910 [Streptosporangium oxazolinicum]|uniref:DNA methylase adenine-specific domain-containing protein n=1 Tax=Streptosporangium oxazolinicum TaxID=909287 RepID=A0ABP8ANU1_9ACTN